ncbi:MAG: c-type cytochrome [Gammaproteobacteria bacterium]|uniref:C-type cytochrome n=1 Tax=Candidatus Thiopontia autotrophica TaxID=2841688 RepID=A0A8J6P414_9GAMM|nr:c-type cytochrome [Candidatus Thiopontia autotrophica]MBL6968727.1 c-type cytochrome [Gammaproteobacteria bacterium]
MKRFGISAFWQAIIVTIAAYLIFTNAFPPLMPKSLVVQFMLITVIGVLLYFSFDDERWAEFLSPIQNVLRGGGFRLTVTRWLFLLAIPAVVGYTTYGLVKPSLDSPVELRQVHPAPPSTVKIWGKNFDLNSLESPIRTEVLTQWKSGEREGAMEIYNESVNAGRDVYYGNCFFCHGDLLDGKGHYAEGFNPQPINFQDPTVIPQQQEAFLFWRAATGGPGLPKEGTPWNSAMPVWHEMLSEDDIWNVLMFIFDYNEQVPRIWNLEDSEAATGIRDSILEARKGMGGDELYQFRCMVCHGEEGMGDGVAAELMYPKPRDFSLSMFKYKSSPGTILPRDEDLFHTIKFGLDGTGMPGWGTLLSDEQISSLIPVIKSFDIAAAWPPEEADDEDYDEDSGRYLKDDFQVITEREPEEGQIAYTPESIEKGKAAFEKSCTECHGDTGRGNIMSGKQLADDWGNRIWPRDLTKPWTWRATNYTAGKTPEESRDQTVRNIYSRLSIGIPGTPMPAHRATEEGNKDPVSLEDRWHIANYVYSLRETTTQLGDNNVIRAAKVAGALPDSMDDAGWEGAEPTTLMMVPNIIKEERLFTPLNDAITVRALYNKKEIALLLEFDDRTDSRPGEETSEGIQDEDLELFSDAVAVQFPKEDGFETSPVVVKPLYRHGDGRHHTTMWYWNAGSVEPAVADSGMLLDASGPDKKIEPRIGDTSLLTEGRWKDGRWQVLMKRSRNGGGRDGKTGDLNFVEGRFLPISFANWDGSNGEKGARHTLTTWTWLVLPPEIDEQRLYGVPGGVAFAIFLAGLILVRTQRRGAK